MKSLIPAPASDDLDEASWVEGELVRSLMETAAYGQWTALLLSLVMAGMLLPHVPRAELALWFAASLVMALLRLWIIHGYNRSVRTLGPREQIGFMARRGWTWPLSGCVWGLSVLLFVERTPIQVQFVCWALLLGLGTLAVNVFSPHFRTMQRYTDAQALTIILAMAWRLAVGPQPLDSDAYLWALLLIVVYWRILTHVGRRLHGTHRHHFELLYRNVRLIESLRSQTQAALEAVETKNRFLQSAAHDIRQPVHALGFYADWLSSEPELVHEIAPKIVKSTKAVNALFDSLFDLVRLDSGQLRFRIESLPVSRLLQDLELQYRPMAEAKGLTFRIHVVDGEIASDAVQLGRILGNLVANAVKYTERGGILLAARRSAEGLRIEVWDTGPGIAPEHQAAVFREFYKVPAHAGTEDGFGIGLAIVSRLTVLLGHRLSLDSRPGRGTVFRLHFVPATGLPALRTGSSVGARPMSG